jgi:hypothetical protein
VVGQTLGWNGVDFEAFPDLLVFLNHRISVSSDTAIKAAYGKSEGGAD